MKWIGQNIWSFISRFRSDVYLESTDTGTIASGGNLGLDSNNKIVKSASPSGTIDLTSEVTGILPVLNGGIGVATLADNCVLTGTGTSAITAEAKLQFALHGDGVTSNFAMPTVADDTDGLLISTTTSGASTIATFDSGGDAAHLTLNVDGNIIIDSHEADADGSGISLAVQGTNFAEFNTHHSASFMKLYENGGASTDDYFFIQVGEHGATTLVTQDLAATAADFKVQADGDITLDAAGGIEINADSGIISFRDNTAALATISSTGLSFLDNASAGIRFEGTTDDAHQTFLTAGEPTADHTITLPNATGTVALTQSTARQVVSLRTDDAYVMYLGSVNRWYQANRVFSSIGTQSTLDSASVTDSVAITASSYIAIRSCTVHSVVIAWYPTQTSDIEFEILKVPLVDNSTSNVTFAQMTHTDHNASYTANKNYVRIFAITGGNTLTAGQGLALVARRTSGSATYMNGGQIYAEIEITG